MPQLSSEEHALVEELLECIAEAMGRLEEVDPEYANKTKLQKLLYLAIDEYDLPVTYSWYLAGAIVPGDPVSPTHLESTVDDLPSTEGPSVPSSEEENGSSADSASEPTHWAPSDAPAEDQIGAGGRAAVDDGEPDETSSEDVDADSSAETNNSVVEPILFSDIDSSDGSDSNEYSTGGLCERRDDVVDFYESVLPNVWYQNTMQFLQNFYLEHAPSAYRDLYVQSTHFRTRLTEVESAVQAHVEGERPAQSIDEIVDAAGLDVSEMHCTIRGSDALKSTFDGFVAGTDLIEDGLMMLAQQTPESLRREHVAAVRSMQDFFYYHVWRYPCLVVSRETATGPSASRLRSERQRSLTDYETEMERAATRFERELADAGLEPEYSDYPREDDEFDEPISGLADQYLQ